MPRAEVPHAEKPRPMRVLYIDIDCLRPDHLGCYGYGRETSPNIDRLAAESLLFANCHTSDAPACRAGRRFSAGGSASTTA